MEWREIKPIGAKPQARAGHTMSLVGESTMFLCSGGDNHVLSDVLCFIESLPNSFRCSF